MRGVRTGYGQGTDSNIKGTDVGPIGTTYVRTSTDNYGRGYGQPAAPKDGGLMAPRSVGLRFVGAAAGFERDTFHTAARLPVFAMDEA